MKTLIVSSMDILGGASRAAYRIHKGFQSQGFGSVMLVQRKASDDPTVIGPAAKRDKVLNQLRPHFDSLPLQLYRNRNNIEWSVGWLPNSITGEIDKINPDIVNLHWINNGYLPWSFPAGIKKPLVWTLQDCWAFTGGCHYPFNCTGYQESCGSCPQLGSRHERDLSRLIWKQKAKHWQKSNITLVAISNWVAEGARHSSLFHKARIEVIPNGLDTQRFKPIEKQAAREILNLSPDKKLVLFGALDVTQKRKGFHLLSSALNNLRSKELHKNTELVIFGTLNHDDKANFDFQLHNLGFLHDDYSLALLYSACDVMVVPSIEEAFGQTISESMACGTPVVAFKIGGIPDLIDHLKNGFLALPFDTEDLARGIDWILFKADQQKLRQEARHKAEREFSIACVTGKYLELYKDILNKRQVQ
jgi:glycosyltransferase involved in cell wall biosynthesis